MMTIQSKTDPDNIREGAIPLFAEGGRRYGWVMQGAYYSCHEWKPYEPESEYDVVDMGGCAIGEGRTNQVVYDPNGMVLAKVMASNGCRPRLDPGWVKVSELEKVLRRCR